MPNNCIFFLYAVDDNTINEVDVESDDSLDFVEDIEYIDPALDYSKANLNGTNYTTWFECK